MVEGKRYKGGCLRSKSEEEDVRSPKSTTIDTSILLQSDCAARLVRPTSAAAKESRLINVTDFLRISRGTIDDSIVQNLNALMTPSKRPWDPSSTAERQIRPVERRPTDPQACQNFKEDVLFQSWQVRSNVLNYCAGVALDPGDPDLLLKEVESARERERIVDERLDPYSGRFFPREARTESLANLIRNERSVEGIIRSRTWGLVCDRCGESESGWESALNKWRENKQIS